MAPKPPFVPVHVAKLLLISHARPARARALNHQVNDDKVSVIKPSMGLLTRNRMKVLDKAIDGA